MGPCGVKAAADSARVELMVWVLGFGVLRVTFRQLLLGSGLGQGRCVQFRLRDSDSVARVKSLSAGAD